MTGDGKPVDDPVWRYGVYKPANRDCELAKYFPSCDRGEVMVQIGNIKTRLMVPTWGDQIHHAWGGRMGRWDRVWNVVNVCDVVHRWAERYKTEGRVLVARCKLDKREMDEEAAFRCLGFYPIGKLASATLELDWVRPILESVLAERQAA